MILTFQLTKKIENLKKLPAVWHQLFTLNGP